VEVRRKRVGACSRGRQSSTKKEFEPKAWTESGCANNEFPERGNGGEKISGKGRNGGCRKNYPQAQTKKRANWVSTQGIGGEKRQQGLIKQLLKWFGAKSGRCVRPKLQRGKWETW